MVDDQGALIAKAEVRVLERPDLIGLPAPNGTVSFKSVPSGTYRMSATYPGFKDKIVDGVVVLEGRTSEITVKMEEAPPKASDFRVHQDLENLHMYSTQLADIGQPLLCQQSVSDHTESYRFLWVPTFVHPIFLRVDIEPDGAATLLTFVWKGEGGYEWGKAERKQRKLTLEEESHMFATLADIGFWGLPSKVENPPNVVILDGTEWLIEGVKDGKCHVVTRYSSPLTELFAKQFLAQVARIRPYYQPAR